MHGKGLKRIGDWLPRVTDNFFNRTGATLLKGQAAMIDILATQAETTSIFPGGSGEGTSSWGNLTPCTQAAINQGTPVVICLDDTVLDNKKGEFLIWGWDQIACLDDDISTTDADRGDGIAMLVSESAVALQALANGNRQLGLWLQDAAADSTDTDRLINASSHLRYGLWTGGWPSCNLDA